MELLFIRERLQFVLNSLAKREGIEIWHKPEDDDIFVTPPKRYCNWLRSGPEWVILASPKKITVASMDCGIMSGPPPNLGLIESSEM